jgi:glycosyltransferase involved in cell wall biosynthesis
MSRTFRVAAVISHAVQHFCPQYTSWAKLPNVDLRVFLASDHGLLAYADQGFGRDVKWAGIRFDFPHEFLRDAKGRTVSDSIDAPDLADRLSMFSPDVVVVYGYSQRLQRRAVRWARSAGASVLMASDSELRARRSWPVRAMKALVVPSLLKDVTLFLTVGDANEAYYRHYGISDDRFVRCFFPIDVNHYDSVVARREGCRNVVRSALGIPAHHKVLLTVGKLLPRKRQADLVRFSNSLQGQRDDVTVVLAGSGPDEASLRTLARREGAGGVVFAGFVQPEPLAEYNCAADIYVHCSDNEPHSLAISEAIYCGLPVVLSDRCGSYGPTDDVQPGLNGLVYRCGDVRDMSRCIMHVLEEEGVRALMCEASTRIGRAHQVLAHGDGLVQALALVQADSVHKS